MLYLYFPTISGGEVAAELCLSEKEGKNLVKNLEKHRGTGRINGLVIICTEDSRAEALNQELFEDFMVDKSHRLMFRQVRLSTALPTDVCMWV